MEVSGKEADGKFKLREIVDTLGLLPGVSFEEGSKHPVIAKFSGVPTLGMPGRCALAKSTSYERHIVPWVRKVTGYDRRAIDTAFREKYWEAKT